MSLIFLLVLILSVQIGTSIGYAQELQPEQTEALKFPIQKIDIFFEIQDQERWSESIRFSFSEKVMKEKGTEIETYMNTLFENGRTLGHVLLSEPQEDTPSTYTFQSGTKNYSESHFLFREFFRKTK